MNKKTGGLTASVKKTKPGSVSKGVGATIRRSSKTTSYAFAKEKVVPPGSYRSQIADVQMSETKSGAEAVDVHYDLTDPAGKKYHVKMRYPVDSYYFEELCDALVDAGIPENADISAAIGVTETIELAYDEDSSFGSFVSREPCAVDAEASAASRAKINSLLDEFEDDEDDGDEWDD